MSITRSLPARMFVPTRHLPTRGVRRSERGDVPGWVLITLMTAGLVTALWVVAKGQLISMFQNALSSVTG